MKPRYILLAAALLLGGKLHAQTSVTYIGPTGLDNSWTLGSNWTGGSAPVEGGNAIINGGEVYIPFTPISPSSLTLGPGKIIGSSLVVEGHITLNDGAIVANGQLVTPAGITFGSNVTLDNVNGLSNGLQDGAAATANWDSGTLTFANIATASNKNTSTWNANGGTYASADGLGINLFDNYGVFNKNSGAALTIEPRFNNSTGSIMNVNQGELQLLGGGTHNGAIIVDNGTTLSLSGTHQIYGGGASLTVGSLAHLNINGGTTSVDVPYSHSGTSGVASGATVNLNGNGTHTGSFSNAGTLNFSGFATRTIASSAAFSGSGTINFQSGATTFETANRSFAGPVNFQGGTVSLEAGGSFSGPGPVNFNGAIITTPGAFSINNPLTMSAQQWNGGGTVAVTNSFNFSSGEIRNGGTLTASGGVTFSSESTKYIRYGQTFNLTGTTSSTWTGGGIYIGEGATFNNQSTLSTNINGTISGGDPVSTFNNTGTFTKSGGSGTTSINYGVNFNNAGTVNVSSGTLQITAPVIQHSGSNLTGGTWNVTNGASLDFNSGGNITTNQGTVMLDGAGSSFNRLTTALNNNQGSFTIKNDRDLTTAGAYTNSGTTRVEDSTTVMTIGAGGSAAYTQTIGATVLVGGAIIDASVFNLNGGELKGSGTIASSVVTGGTQTIAPGLSAGVLTIDGDLTLSSGSTLAMEIGGLGQGSAYDFLDVNGTLTLAGMLDLSLINAFDSLVQPNDVFTLATADSPILGAFSNVASGDRIWANPDISFNVWYGLGSIFDPNSLVITGAPEPSRTVLLMTSLLGALMRRRRGTPRLELRSV